MSSTKSSLSSAILAASPVACATVLIAGLSSAQPIPAPGVQAAEHAQESKPPQPPASAVAPQGSNAPPPASAAPPNAPAPPGPPPGPHGTWPASDAQGSPPAPAAQPANAYPTHPWELPAVDVAGEARPELREEDRVGDYGQPRWSAVRRFPTTRIYVIPKGKVEAEYWMRYDFPFDNATSHREVRSMYEFGVGLGHRLQMDLYLVTQQEGHGEDARIELKREQIELRYALADWGRIWGNPTFYFEYQRRSEGHDWFEGKILLGGQIAPGWHGGLNLVMEKELGGSSWEHEYNASAGLSRTIVDETFHLGVEGYAEGHDFSGARFQDFGKSERMLLAGPSFLVHPVSPMHILIAPMFGKGSGGEDKMKAMTRIWFVTGWTF